MFSARLSNFVFLAPSTAFLALTVGILAPSPAEAAPLTVGDVFQDAALFVQLVMVALVLTMAAAAVVCARRLASGPNLAGGSAFISALRYGGPLAGLLGAAYTALYIFIGFANSPAPVPINVIAPGLAEATLLGGLGLLAGAVGVICHWAIEARIDRAVLSS
ncbi:MAG: hypothetical protein JWO33_2506 [Caulobacteraceae bacterium]|nr:hypothetical protein [Caulobacteraceae bacterium]